MSTADLIRSLRAVMTKLAKYEHLPALDSIAAYGHGVVLGVEGPFRSWKTLANLAQWAREFEVSIKISLSWGGGSGDVETSFTLANETVRITEGMSTAHAYQLGGVLGKPLTKDEPLVVTADELLAAIAQIDPAATS